MSKVLIRCGLAIVLFAATLAAIFGTMVEAADPVAHFTATTVNIVPGNGAKSDALKLDLLRWSSDAERGQVVAAAGDDKQLLDALQHQPSLGYIWTSASVGFTVRYAFEQKASDGSERVVFATDKRIDSGGPQPWTVIPKPSSPDYPFTVIELHLTRAGGEGKMSLAGTVSVDSNAKTLALQDFAAAPMLLRGVKRQ